MNKQTVLIFSGAAVMLLQINSASGAENELLQPGARDRFFKKVEAERKQAARQVTDSFTRLVDSYKKSAAGLKKEATFAYRVTSTHVHIRWPASYSQRQIVIYRRTGSADRWQQYSLRSPVNSAAAYTYFDRSAYTSLSKLKQQLGAGGKLWEFLSGANQPFLDYAARYHGGLAAVRNLEFNDTNVVVAAENWQQKLLEKTAVVNLAAGQRVQYRLAVKTEKGEKLISQSAWLTRRDVAVTRPLQQPVLTRDGNTLSLEWPAEKSGQINGYHVYVRRIKPAADSRFMRHNSQMLVFRGRQKPSYQISKLKKGLYMVMVSREYRDRSSVESPGLQVMIGAPIDPQKAIPQLNTVRQIKGESSVQLSWKVQSKSGLSHFNIMRRRADDNSWQAVNRIAVPVQSIRFTDRNVKPGSWYYRVQAVSDTGQVFMPPAGRPVTVRPSVKPGRSPIRLLDVQPGQVTVYFRPAAHAALYHVYRRRGSAGPFQAVARFKHDKGKKEYSYTDRAVSSGQSFCYSVAAQSREGITGERGRLECIQAKGSENFESPSVVSAQWHSGQVTLSWKLKYRAVYKSITVFHRSANDTQWTVLDNTLPPTARSYRFVPEKVNCEHFFRLTVTGKNSVVSPPSMTAAVRAGARVLPPFQFFSVNEAGQGVDFNWRYPATARVNQFRIFRVVRGHEKLVKSMDGTVNRFHLPADDRRRFERFIIEARTTDGGVVRSAPVDLTLQTTDNREIRKQ